MTARQQQKLVADLVARARQRTARAVGRFPLPGYADAERVFLDDLRVADTYTRLAFHRAFNRSELEQES